MKISALDAKILNAMDGVCYMVDAQGVIVHVGADHWNAAAAESGAESLSAEGVVGTNLFAHLKGEELRANLETVFSRLRSGSARSWAMPCSCDSPTVDRESRLAVTPVFDGEAFEAFLFQSVVLSENHRPPVDLFDFNALSALIEAERQLPIIRMCSYCQKIRDEPPNDDTWIAVEEYYRRGGTGRVRVSHGICPPCLEIASAGFE